MIIRTATADDRDAIVAVVRDAFSSGGHDGREEVDIVLETWRREAAPAVFDVLAVEDGEVIGHVMASRGDLDGRAVLGVAPVSVAPGHQGQGVGSELMRDLIQRADDAGEPMLVLLGSPAYYGRFGFEPAGDHGVTYAAFGTADPHFQLVRLAAYDSSVRGEYRYCWEL